MLNNNENNNNENNNNHEDFKKLGGKDPFKKVESYEPPTDFKAEYSGTNLFNLKIKPFLEEVHNICRMHHIPIWCVISPERTEDHQAMVNMSILPGERTPRIFRLWHMMTEDPDAFREAAGRSYIEQEAAMHPDKLRQIVEDAIKQSQQRSEQIKDMFKDLPPEKRQELMQGFKQFLAKEFGLDLEGSDDE